MVDIAMIKADVWDDRKCNLGEGPASSGKNNQRGYWVDITGKKVLWRDLDTNKTGEYSVDEEIGFVIPRAHGGELIGTTSGPFLRDTDGSMHALPNRVDVDGAGEKFPTRWNDAKVSPNGDLWLGTLTADFTPGESALYRLDSDGSHMVDYGLHFGEVAKFVDLMRTSKLVKSFQCPQSLHHLVHLLDQI